MKLKVGSGFVKKVHKVKNHTHVKGTFLFGIYCWTRFIKKLLKRANKKQNNFDIYKKIFGPFFALLPPYQPGKLKFRKIKTPRDIIILHMYTINDVWLYGMTYHMMYGSWDLECSQQCLTILDHFFCPFTPLRTRQNKILKN